MKRDFTYIDDIVDGILGAMKNRNNSNHKIYNLGNNNPEVLLEFVKLIEKNFKFESKKNYYRCSQEMFQKHSLTLKKVKKI